jgi:phenylalanyl-tRNA synthetase beta chain
MTDFVDLVDVPPAAAADALTMAGFKVESVRPLDLANILVGRVITQTPHPRSRSPIWIHEVDFGSGRIERILAGAGNAGPGSLVPVAPPGATVPSGTTVRESFNVAGVSGHGMLCSAAELGLGDDHSGILLLDAGEPGRPLSDVYPLDALLEVEVTSNRPDCLAHFGLARELAAYLGRPLRRDFMPAFTGGAEPPGAELVRVTIEAGSLCARYIAAPMTGVRLGPSPRWMQRRLRAAGVRPIVNAVDVTNYVMLEYGQPLHVFDLRRLAGPEIRVRTAAPGERLLCLDGEERDLTADMLVIADAERPVAVAGVIGGLETGVGESTTDLLLESANFAGVSVRATSRALQLRTESSARFEKQLSPELALAGARRAVGLLRDAAAATVHRDWVDSYPAPQAPVRVRVWPARVDAVLGTHVPLEATEDILRRLDFHVRVDEGGAWDVLPPVYRLDVSIAEDVIEEVGRIHGYDQVAPTLPGSRRPSRPPVARTPIVDRLRQVLAGAGLNETVNPALVSSGRQLELGIGDRMLELANPLSEDEDSLRTSLIPSLLVVLARNRDRDSARAAFFESARVYLRRRDEPGAQPEEPERLAAVLPAEANAADGRAAVLRLKSIVDRFAHATGTPGPAYEAARGPLFHPGRCARVMLGDGVAGQVGELHPSTLAPFALDGMRVAAFELDVQAFERVAERRRARSLPRFPAAGRDLAAVVGDPVPAAELLGTIRIAAGELLESVTAFDEFRGGAVPPGMKSVAFRLSFRSPERTLTDSDVVAAMDRVRTALREAHGAGFRE